MDEQVYTTPKQILYVDICRDGGSYVLGYLDFTETVSELEMLVEKNDQYSRVGYHIPTLARYPIEQRQAIDWEVAMALEASLRPLIDRGVGAEALSRFEEMFALIRRKGKLCEGDWQ
jgi:hypothetical protein